MRKRIGYALQHTGVGSTVGFAASKTIMASKSKREAAKCAIKQKRSSRLFDEVFVELDDVTTCKPGVVPVQFDTLGH